MAVSNGSAAAVASGCATEYEGAAFFTHQIAPQCPTQSWLRFVAVLYIMQYDVPVSFAQDSCKLLVFA